MILDLIEKHLRENQIPYRREEDLVKASVLVGDCYRRLFFLLDGDQVVMVCCSLECVRWLSDPGFNLFAWIDSALFNLERLSRHVLSINR